MPLSIRLKKKQLERLENLAKETNKLNHFTSQKQ